MTLPIYQIDAFTHALFKGNPAAVCVLDEWLDESLMQSIAAENNLAETAFIVGQGRDWQIRWFTPNLEVPLCGHATLASAFVIVNELGFSGERISFESKSGPLHVSRQGDGFVLDFPAMMVIECEAPEALVSGLGLSPQVVYRVDADPNYYAVYDHAGQVRALKPDMDTLATLHPYGVVVTAPADEGGDYDCVSRYFLPSFNIPEDPVTGSIHCALVPYWSQRLGKSTIRAFQASVRGGQMTGQLKGNRVELSGTARKYLQGTIWIE